MTELYYRGQSNSTVGKEIDVRLLTYIHPLHPNSPPHLSWLGTELEVITEHSQASSLQNNKNKKQTKKENQDLSPTHKEVLLIPELINSIYGNN